MMQDTSLIGLSRTCFMAVGPARIAICALTLLSEEDPRDPATQARLSIAKGRIQRADRMLRETFTAELAKIGHAPGQAVIDARDDALHCISPVLRALDGPLDQMTEQMGGRLAFRNFFFDDAEPRITFFLERMTEDLTAAAESERAAQQLKALNSVRDAKGVGRAISLIAINAAIEASRSGDRGFKVIADEVKSLAAQTQKLLGELGDALRQT